MNYRTVVKLLALALLVLPSLASADDTMPDVADVHVGVAALEFGGDAEAASGAGVFADAEGGWRVGHLDLTGFGAYATRHVDGNFDDGFGTINKLDYRVHVIDLGARATVRWQHGYGGLGLAFENEMENGTSRPPSGSAQTISISDQHVAIELRLGVIVQHVDVSGSMSFASQYGETFATFRLGVGYRF